MLNYRGFRADRLKEAMKENGATFEDICEGMRRDFYLLWVGSDINYIRGIINGKALPGILELYSICKTVGCSADYLLGLKDEMY